MEQASTIGLDIAKRVFQVHGADASGRAVCRKRLPRAKVLAFLSAQPPCTVALEACGGAHHWGREIGKLGHTVRLIPPAYVKPYVKRQKNDAADAEAICEAATRPSMRFVPVKSEAQQASAIVFRARDLLVRQRTQCINALRGHLAEYGYVLPQGITHAGALIGHWTRRSGSWMPRLPGAQRPPRCSAGSTFQSYPNFRKAMCNIPWCNASIGYASFWHARRRPTGIPMVQLTARPIDAAPKEAIGSGARIAPIRKPAGFVPAVQRWSFLLPSGEAEMRIAFFGAQAQDEAALNEHSLHEWLDDFVVTHPAGPTTLDHARIRSASGNWEHVACAYWVSSDRFAIWAADQAAEAWWRAPQRLHGQEGCWREILRVPRDRQESIYWHDYPAGLMTSPDVEIFPTPYCGYYGAMRDRIPAAAHDRLDPAAETGLCPPVSRAGFGEHWSVHPPGNLAVIRSANTWGRMDREQRADYEAKLRGPLMAGMDFLADNPLPSGCACLRWQRTTNAAGAEAPEAHAHGYFLSLGHMERWAEDHATHAAIFGAAIARYREYGSANQLRTWHEVFVLPQDGQVFEYVNCHPATGLLPWFDAERLR